MLWDSSVSKLTGCELEDHGSIPGKDRDASLLSMGTEGFLTKDKAATL